MTDEPADDIIERCRALQLATLAVADDAIALLNEWDKQVWKGPGSRVMDADLADLYRRLAQLMRP